MKSALRNRILFLCFAAVALVATGCKKIKNTSNKTVVTVTPDENNGNNMGGKGGNAAIKITPNHDGLNIDSCKVFIKYNSAVIPANGVYDDSTWCKTEDGQPVGTFTGLKPGNYYLFARGWDLIRSQKVRGGLPFIITTEHSGTTHSIVLPVDNYQ